ncbi:hypothetical protein Tco_1046970 [Tanacetum coccineum]
MTKSQDGETRLCLVDDLTVLKITSPLTNKDRMMKDMLPEYIPMQLAESILFSRKSIRVLPNPNSAFRFESSEFYKRSFQSVVDSVRAIAASHMWQDFHQYHRLRTKKSGHELKASVEKENVLFVDRERALESRKAAFENLFAELNLFDVQSAFVANRQILDGPFILNELLSWCKFKKLNGMIFKVDFEKAFDSVKWDYLDETLKAFGFGVIGSVVVLITPWDRCSLTVALLWSSSSIKA